MKQLNDSKCVITVDPDYMRWLAVHKREPLTGDRGPEPAAGSLKWPKGLNASTLCSAGRVDLDKTETTPWGIRLTQADDPLLRSINMSHSILYCVIDTGRCRSCCEYALHIFRIAIIKALDKFRCYIATRCSLSCFSYLDLSHTCRAPWFIPCRC